MLLPPLELHAEVTTADGRRFRWDANDRQAHNRPSGIRFATKLMEGFAGARCGLRRGGDIDWRDLGLNDTIRFVGVDGSVAYEGRGARFATNTDESVVDVEAVGWMTHARDRPATALFVDRDLNRWQDTSATRRGNLIGAGFGVHPPSVQADLSTPQLRTGWEGVWSTVQPISEALYDAGPGLLIDSIYYAWQRENTAHIDPANTNWQWKVGTYADDTGANQLDSGNLRAAGPGTGTVTPAADQRFGFVQFLYAATTGGTDGVSYGIGWTTLAVYGNHGLTKRGSAPEGYYAADMIRWLANRYAPRLDTSAVQDTGHIIHQAAWPEVTDIYDMWLKLNSYERWQLAVWENKRLHYQPLDTETADWVVRTDDPRADASFDGPSLDRQANGIIVRFQNIATGRADLVSPDTHSELKDTDETLPANQHDLKVWRKVQLPDPNSTAGAVRIGQKILADYNRQRHPARITVRGHIQDTSGIWHPGWAPRAGDTVRVEDRVGGPVRVIHETEWDHDARTLTLTVDSEAKDVDALLDQALTRADRP